MAGSREKFATQVDSEILAAVRTLAQRESRQIQALVEEGLADLVEKYKRTKPRVHVMAAYQAMRSMRPFTRNSLNERLLDHPRGSGDSR
jgi:hypothetical protein